MEHQVYAFRTWYKQKHKNSHTHRRKMHFMALKNMVLYVTTSNSKVHPKNLLLSFPIWRPIFGSVSLEPLSFLFLFTQSSSFTRFHPHFLSPSLLFPVLYFFSVTSSSLLCPCTTVSLCVRPIIQHHKIMLVRISVCSQYIIPQNILHQHCTALALCCTADKEVRHPAILNTPVI